MFLLGCVISTVLAQAEEICGGKYTQDWQIELLNQLDLEAIKTVEVYCYDFRATSQAQYEARMSDIDTYLEDQGLKDLMQQLSDETAPFITYEDIEEGLEDSTLVELPRGVLNLADYERPIRVQPETAKKVLFLVTRLEEEGVEGVFWNTSSVRPQKQNLGLRALGFPAPPDEWGDNLSSFGLTLNLAVSGSNGSYSRFLDQIDEEAYNVAAQKVEDHWIPTIDELAGLKDVRIDGKDVRLEVIKDRDFLTAYNILKFSDFELIDLTGLYSVAWSSTGANLSLGPINPVFLLVDREALLSLTAFQGTYFGILVPASTVSYALEN